MSITGSTLVLAVASVLPIDDRAVPERPHMSAPPELAAPYSGDDPSGAAQITCQCVDVWSAGIRARAEAYYQAARPLDDVPMF